MSSFNLTNIISFLLQEKSDYREIQICCLFFRKALAILTLPIVSKVVRGMWTLKVRFTKWSKWRENSWVCCWNHSDPDIWSWLGWSNYERLHILRDVILVRLLSVKIWDLLHSDMFLLYLFISQSIIKSYGIFINASKTQNTMWA